jgi:hypothetical protein
MKYYILGQIGFVGYSEKLEEVYEIEELAMVENVDSRQAFAQCG